MAKAKPSWTPKDIRLMLDYIDAREPKHSKSDYAGLAKCLIKTGEIYFGVQDVQNKLSEIFKAAKLKPEARIQQLWMEGTSILDLQHDCLKGVYAEEELAAYDNSARGTSESSPVEGSVLAVSTVR